MNKKADEKYLSIWMFLIWAIIGVSIVLGVLMFYSVQGDVRQIEAQLLIDKLSSCITTNFNYGEITKSDFDIYAKCGLNKDVFEKENFYYFNINLTGVGVGQLGKIIRGGNNWETECNYQFLKKEADREDKFPQCVKQESTAFDSKTNKKYIVSITTASNQK
jgi:hypothetical protein